MMLSSIWTASSNLVHPLKLLIYSRWRGSSRSQQTRSTAKCSWEDTMRMRLMARWFTFPWPRELTPPHSRCASFHAQYVSRTHMPKHTQTRALAFLLASFAAPFLKHTASYTSTNRTAYGVNISSIKYGDGADAVELLDFNPDHPHARTSYVGQFDSGTTCLLLPNSTGRLPSSLSPLRSC